MHRQYRATAARATAYAQPPLKWFTASNILPQVLAHPALDGRPLTANSLGHYLNLLVKPGGLESRPQKRKDHSIKSREYRIGKGTYPQPKTP